MRFIKGRIPHNFINIKNKRFGLLLVIKGPYLHTKSNNKKENRWICICLSCKKQTRLLSSNLIRRNKKGCFKCSRIGYKDNGLTATVKKAYYKHKLNAKIRNIESYLTFPEYKLIVLKPCTYCNFTSSRKILGHHGYLKINSVDRKNNELFYKKSNSQPVCFQCQHAKKDMTDMEYKNFIKRLITYNNS